MNYDTCIVILQCMAILWLHNGTLPACGCSCGSGRLWLYTQRVYRWSSCVWYCVLVGRNYMWKRLTIMLMYSVWCHSKMADSYPTLMEAHLLLDFRSYCSCYLWWKRCNVNVAELPLLNFIQKCFCPLSIQSNSVLTLSNVYYGAYQSANCSMNNNLKRLLAWWLKIFFHYQP